MPIDKNAVLTQIDLLINRVEVALPHLNSPSKYESGETTELLTLIKAAIDRLAPPNSAYQEKAHTIFGQKTNGYYLVIYLSGVLKALRADYEAGHLQAIHELIHADVFSDFLDMASHLLDQGYKDPAAVLAGGVLEEHLRKLCVKNDIEIMAKEGKHKTADQMNADLAKADVYNNLDQKSVIVWLGFRNKAAHGDYAAYNEQQVSLMIQSLLDFITRNPA